MAEFRRVGTTGINIIQNKIQFDYIDMYQKLYHEYIILSKQFSGGIKNKTSFLNYLIVYVNQLIVCQRYSIRQRNKMSSMALKLLCGKIMDSILIHTIFQ